MVNEFFLHKTLLHNDTKIIGENKQKPVFYRV